MATASAGPCRSGMARECAEAIGAVDGACDVACRACFENAMPRFKLAMKWLLGAFFIGAGVLHFVKPDFYVRIMPPYLPWPRELVYVSGFFEVLLGTLLVVPRFTVPAAWGLIALLIAVFPANIHMAMNADQYPALPATFLWARLPLQGLFIAWAYWMTRRDDASVKRR